MKTKTKPIFADQFIAGTLRRVTEYVPNVDVLAIHARIRRAERMVFNDEASLRVGMVLRDIPELLIEQLQFARTPFDLCWIEYNSNIVWETIMGCESDPFDLTRDETVGLLIDHGRVNVFSKTFGGEICMLPFVYHLNTEWPLQDQVDFCQKFKVSQLGIDHWLWGAATNKLRDEDKSDLLRALRDVTMVEYIGINPRAEMLQVTMGDFKNVVALLLMLNQPSVTNYIHVPRQRGWIGNKPKPFLSHHNVTIALDAHTHLVSFGRNNNDGELRRRHPVRGHYCHDQTARDYARIAGCVHYWEPMDEDWEPWLNSPVDEREHWKCKICDGKRWWRTAHERGSEEKGFISHQYNVTP